MSQSKNPEQMDLEKEYEEYVKKITPTHNLYLQMLKAFITGGAICTAGQLLLNFAGSTLGMDREMAGSFCSLVLVLVSVLLTGFNIYPSIVKFGGAGALVQTPWLLPPWNLKGRDRSSASAAKSLPSPGRLFFTVYLQAGCWDFFTGREKQWGCFN